MDANYVILAAGQEVCVVVEQDCTTFRPLIFKSGEVSDRITCSSNMTPETFFRHVERLRAAQKEYFRTRSSEALRTSKRLEREVDAEIERVNKILNERRNPLLNFNNPNHEQRD